MKDLQKALDIVTALNELGYSRIGCASAGFGGSEACISIEVAGHCVYDDQADPSDDFTLEACRRKIVEHAKELLKTFDTDNDCPTCNGTGEITEAHESYAVETLGCPHCMGSGKKGGA